jgi:GntR family transcriptional repressor for pyruvate dehydrogenase complex
MASAGIDFVPGGNEGGTGRLKASMVVARDIVRTMYERELRPGDRYLSEAEALQRHKVGRGTYREALRFLELQGVIVMRAGPGGGPEIRQPGWPHLASTIALLLQFADAPLRTILEARIAIEPGMAELAAAHATDEEVAQMAADLDDLEANLGAYRAFNDAYLRFWRNLARSSHNALLEFLSPALRAIVNSAGFVPNEPYRVQLLGRLRRIHETVAAHDPKAAWAEMRELEVEFYERLTSGYPRQVERVVSWTELEAVSSTRPVA